MFSRLKSTPRPSIHVVKCRLLQACSTLGDPHFFEPSVRLKYRALQADDTNQNWGRVFMPNNSLLLSILVLCHNDSVFLRRSLRSILAQNLSSPVEVILLNDASTDDSVAIAIAKIAGIKLCENYTRQHGTDYRSVTPTNLYGPGDNFHPATSHVLPALIRRFHEAAQADARQVVIWGSGTPRREFLHVDDMAEASLFTLDLPAEVYAANTQPMLSHINFGSGTDVSILELAQMIAQVTGFTGRISTDPSKPDGTARKLMDISRLANLGWRAKISLQAGIAATYQWYLTQPPERLRR